MAERDDAGGPTFVGALIVFLVCILALVAVRACS